MKKENKKLILSIVAVALIIVLVGGATYAYWTWASANNTNVTITVTGGTMTIDGGGNITTKAKLAPAQCNNTNYAIQRKIKVTATNDTTTDFVETIQLKISKIEANAIAKTNNTLTDTVKANIKWALVRSNATQHAASTWKLTTCPNTTAITPSETVGAVLASNTFSGLTTNSVITLYNRDVAAKKATGNAASATTTDYYELYIWIDPSYSGTATSGTSVSDPLQDLTLNLVWQGTMTNTQ